MIQDLSGLSSASIVSVQNTSDGVRITVSVTDLSGNTKRWTTIITDPAQQQLWINDQKAVITLAYLSAAQSLADDVADKNKPAPVNIAVTAISLPTASSYLTTAQAELTALQPKPVLT